MLLFKRKISPLHAQNGSVKTRKVSNSRKWLSQQKSQDDTDITDITTLRCVHFRTNRLGNKWDAVHIFSFLFQKKSWTFGVTSFALQFYKCYLCCVIVLLLIKTNFWKSCQNLRQTHRKVTTMTCHCCHTMARVLKVI